MKIGIHELKYFKMKGLTTSLLWTSGHAGIAGNDEPIKESEEAKNLPPHDKVMTVQDIKKEQSKL